MADVHAPGSHYRVRRKSRGVAVGTRPGGASSGEAKVETLQGLYEGEARGGVSGDVMGVAGGVVRSEVPLYRAYE